MKASIYEIPPLPTFPVPVILIADCCLPCLLSDENVGRGGGGGGELRNKISLKHWKDAMNGNIFTKSGFKRKKEEASWQHWIEGSHA